MKQVRQDLAAEGRSDMVNKVMAYRSGYSAQVRKTQFDRSKHTAY